VHQPVWAERAGGGSPTTPRGPPGPPQPEPRPSENPWWPRGTPPPLPLPLPPSCGAHPIAQAVRPHGFYAGACERPGCASDSASPPACPLPSAPPPLPPLLLNLPPLHYWERVGGAPSLRTRGSRA